VTLTAAQLRAIMVHMPAERAELWTPHLSAAMQEFSITTPPRAAAFLAQVAHESGELSRLVESMNYSADRMIAVWPSRFGHQRGATEAQRAEGRRRAASLAHKPTELALYVYGSRADLGNRPGTFDGWDFIGRSPIAVTGRGNYAAVGKALGLPLLENPRLLEIPQHGARSAGYFWQSHGLNKVVDAGEAVADPNGPLEALRASTRVINGGLIGWPERLAYWQRARTVLA